MAEFIPCAYTGEKATVFVTVVKGSKVTTKAMTAEVAKQKGFFSHEAYDLLEDSGAVPTPAQRRRCPNCGCSQGEFERRGRFGCPECYTTFADMLSDVLKRLHRDSHHVGKVPASAITPDYLRSQMAHTEAEMDAAIARENYEEAAALRDKITTLRERLEAQQTA